MMIKSRRISFGQAFFQHTAPAVNAFLKRIASCLLLALTLGATVTPAHAFWNDTVYIDGRNLMLNGGTWYCYHASLYPVGVNYKSSNFRSYVDAQIQRADYAHLNAVRLTDFIQGTTSDPYDATVWNNIDYVMQKANEKNMKVILDLSTYRNFLKQSQGKMPYNMSDWNSWLDWVANRYKDDARLAYYAIAGEPAPPNSSESLRPTTSQLTNFYRDASNRIRSKDSKHIISSGGLLQLDWNSGIDWQAIFSQPNINLPSLHIYSSGDSGTTLPNVNKWCQNYNRPLINEEFGQQQSVGDGARASYFDSVYNFRQQYGVCGSGFWNFAPGVNSGSFDVNPDTPLTWQKVQERATNQGVGVKFFQDSNYQGSVSHPVTKGNYTLADLQVRGVANDWVSSLQIPSGWKVILYDGDNFTGASWTYTSSQSAISGNDRASSCKIQ